MGAGVGNAGLDPGTVPVAGGAPLPDEVPGVEPGGTSAKGVGVGDCAGALLAGDVPVGTVGGAEGLVGLDVLPVDCAGLLEGLGNPGANGTGTGEGLSGEGDGLWSVLGPDVLAGDGDTGEVEPDGDSLGLLPVSGAVTGTAPGLPPDGEASDVGELRPGHLPQVIWQ